MKRIGISTLVDYGNYGNRLQNYALQETLRKLGLEPKSIINTVHLSKESRRNYLIKSSPMEIIKKVDNRLFKREQKAKKASNKNRLAKFMEFNNKYIEETDYSVSELNIPKQVHTDFDYYITGSDQVWNPNFRHGTSVDFLAYAPKEKRIAYSASFGTDEIPSKFRANYKKWLSEFNMLSVREQQGAKIVKELTGRDAPVLVDPTMLLTKEEWLAVSQRADNRPDTPYLLTYFLGGPSDELRAKLEKLAAEKKMTIINLGDVTEPETYETGPAEFLDYLAHAEAFFTDSFHGVIFSILFQTPFIISERKAGIPSMYSRIETILDNFDMRDREEKGFSGEIFSMDFSHTHDILKQEYEKSLTFLKEGLRIED